MKVVVCGLGQVGYRVTMLLRRLETSVTVIALEAREEFVQRCVRAGAEVKIGDARSDRNLIDAGIKESVALIAAADNDLTNIEAALDAKRLNPAIRTVVRLFDQSIARRLEESIGIDRVLDMSVVSAPVFASAAFGEDVRGAFHFDGEAYIVAEVAHDAFELESLLEAGDDHTSITQRFEDGLELVCERRSFARLAGIETAIPKHSIWKTAAGLSNPINIAKAVASMWASTPIQLKMVALLIAAITTLSVFVFQLGMHLSFADAFYFVITTVTTTGYGDITPKDAGIWLKTYSCLMMLLGSASVATLYSIITDYIVTTKFDQLFGRQKIAAASHVIVAGLGNVGIRTVYELRKMGVMVVAVDRDLNADYRSLLDRSTPFIAGDAREPDTLRRAGIDKAQAVVAVGGDDAMNLSIGLNAKSLNSDARCVVRLFDADFAAKIHGSLNVDAAMSASRIAAPSFVGAALFPKALFSYIRGGRFCVLGRDIPEIGDRWKIEEMVASKSGSLQLVVKELTAEA